MDIKVGQIYKLKDKDEIAMVIGIRNNRIFLGNGNSLSNNAIQNHYILLKDVN
ncbi:hypothetical protein J6TS2_12040 [Heyndrickxia sporothermodurans]|nr:hypothetical protein J6TS2_12040 [Heyndrickxia sporothermodurans]